jgi:hypothetical protein
MKRADRKLWQQARTLQDLADLTCRWLAGEMESQPGYVGPVDIDQHLATWIGQALRDLCGIGFITRDSQGGWAGEDAEGEYIVQTPAVTGYTTQETAEALEQYLPGWVLVEHRPAVRRRGSKGGRGWTVTSVDGEPVTVYGRSMPRDDFDFEWEDAGPQAVKEVRKARLLTIMDTDWEPGHHPMREPEHDFWLVLIAAAAQVRFARRFQGSATASTWTPAQWANTLISDAGLSSDGGRS